MIPKHNKKLMNENWDGVKIEEHKAMDRKLTTPKSRWSWQIGSSLTDEEWENIFAKKHN